MRMGLFLFSQVPLKRLSEAEDEVGLPSQGWWLISPGRGSPLLLSLTPTLQKAARTFIHTPTTPLEAEIICITVKTSTYIYCFGIQVTHETFNESFIKSEEPAGSPPLPLTFDIGDPIHFRYIRAEPREQIYRNH